MALMCSESENRIFGYFPMDGVGLGRDTKLVKGLQHEDPGFENILGSGSSTLLG